MRRGDKDLSHEFIRLRDIGSSPVARRYDAVTSAETSKIRVRAVRTAAGKRINAYRRLQNNWKTCS